MATATEAQHGGQFCVTVKKCVSMQVVFLISSPHYILLGIRRKHLHKFALLTSCEVQFTTRREVNDVNKGNL